MTRIQHPEPSVPPDRLKALADGVFAIVMTLLILELGIPTVEAAEETGLGEALREMWPEFLGYVLSFLVLGIFWLIHHMLFDSIKWYDTTLVWLNIVFLLIAALLPFTTGLFAVHGATTITAVIYGLNMLLLFDLGWAIWTYVTANRRLVEADLDPGLIRGGKVMGGVYSVAMIVPIAVAFAFPVISFLLYGFIVALFIAATVIGQWEIVAVGRRGQLTAH